MIHVYRYVYMCSVIGQLRDFGDRNEVCVYVYVEHINEACHTCEGVIFV